MRTLDYSTGERESTAGRGPTFRPSFSEKQTEEQSRPQQQQQQQQQEQEEDCLDCQAWSNNKVETAVVDSTAKVETDCSSTAVAVLSSKNRTVEEEVEAGASNQKRAGAEEEARIAAANRQAVALENEEAACC